MDKKFSKAKSEYELNDPPIEINQRWICHDRDGNVFRRIRILAPWPTEKYENMVNDGKRWWLYIDEPAKMGLINIHVGVFPEFNLRYVMQLEK